MGERKVQCKYFPPDWDPAVLRKHKKRKSFRDEQIKVRVMLPFTIKCSCCGDFIYKGTKFTTRKEDIQNEDYLGIRKFRFYFKCPNCLQEIVFKTDPKNSDYELETGGTRNFEPWKQSDEIQRLKEEEREQEEKGDSMKALENRTIQSKREMDILDALEEIKERNARKAALSTEEILEERQSKVSSLIAKRIQEEEAEDTAAATLFAETKSKTVKRLDSDSDGDDSKLGGLFGGLVGGTGFGEAKPEEDKPAGLLGGMVMIKKKKSNKKDKKKKKKKKSDKKRKLEDA